MCDNCGCDRVLKGFCVQCGTELKFHGMRERPRSTAERTAEAQQNRERRWALEGR